MRSVIKSVLKKNLFFLSLAKKLESALNKILVKKSIIGQNNTIIYTTSRMRNCRVIIEGNDNYIQLDPGCFLKNVKISMRGNGHKLHIKSNTSLHNGASLWFEDNACDLEIGEGCSMGSNHIALTEDNSSVKIGDGALFANGIEIRTGDSHPIFNLNTKERINPAESVIIGKNVWIGADVSILKGSIISSQTIVATRSVVTKKFLTCNCIIGGVAAKVIKENVYWEVERTKASSKELNFKDNE